MSHVWSPGAGRMIEVGDEIVTGGEAPRKKRRPFQTQWAKLPRSWVEALRQTKSAATKQLAMEILLAEFQRRHTGGEIMLSAAVTRMPSATRWRAARELATLGLIEIESCGRQAIRVPQLHVG